MRTRKLGTLFLLALNFVLFSREMENNNDWKYYFIFSNDIIEFKLSINELLMNKKDTIYFSFEFSNKSNNTILIFPTISYTHLKSDSKRSLLLEHGGLYSPGVETTDELKLIKPKGKVKIEFSLNSTYLGENGFDEYFPIKYSFGFVPNLKLLFKNEYLGSIKTKYKSKDIIEASNIVIFSTLKMNNYLAFYAKLKTDE